MQAGKLTKAGAGFSLRGTENKEITQTKVCGYEEKYFCKI